ncbi:hypothetical protein [Streptomyces minutiscleroticus]|uniref:Uncharacterized protein n=1 Tax=Streptomyces minutiscleroticus TaxID=68238 RepID=A0A918NPY5_9ACTN|nr:hypothetical protein [Streptomyces minutiscleroticus]GGX86170.1 hypothetical protein GCM10010358_45430 [Streptomyces minutiscleroticus]
MVELGVLFGGMAVVVAFLSVRLVRRRGTVTENADGLLVEQARRLQAQSDRAAYNAATVHSSTPTLRDNHLS